MTEGAPKLTQLQEAGERLKAFGKGALTGTLVAGGGIIGITSIIGIINPVAAGASILGTGLLYGTQGFTTAGLVAAGAAATMGTGYGLYRAMDDSLIAKANADLRREYNLVMMDQQKAQARAQGQQRDLATAMARNNSQMQDLGLINDGSVLPQNLPNLIGGGPGRGTNT